MSTKENIARCVGCGKPFVKGQKTKIIYEATAGMNGMSPFGTMHETCFSGAVDLPDSIMAAIRKEAKAKTKKVSAQ